MSGEHAAQDGDLAGRLAAIEERLEAEAQERDDRVGANEIALLEQEHRLIPAVRSMMKHWGRGVSDRRFRAAAVALTWRLFVRGGVIFAISVGGVFTALMAWRSNELLRGQNQLIADQNRYFQEQTMEIRELTEQQIDEARLARRAQLLGTIYDRLPCDEEDQEDCRHVASGRARREAAEALVLMVGPEGRAELFGADFRGVDLSGVELSRANLLRANFQEANLKDAELDGVNLQEADLHDANLRGANLQRANFMGANLLSANLQGVQLQGAKLMNASLRDTDLTAANLSRAYLGAADLHGAIFRLTKLEGAKFVSAFATLRPVAKRRRFFEAIGVTQLQIERSIGDSSTELPTADLKHPCWWRGVTCESRTGNGTPPEGWPENAGPAPSPGP